MFFYYPLTFVSRPGQADGGWVSRSRPQFVQGLSVVTAKSTNVPLCLIWLIKFPDILEHLTCDRSSEWL